MVVRYDHRKFAQKRGGKKRNQNSLLIGNDDLSDKSNTSLNGGYREDVKKILAFDVQAGRQLRKIAFKQNAGRNGTTMPSQQIEMNSPLGKGDTPNTPQVREVYFDEAQYYSDNDQAGCGGFIMDDGDNNIYNLDDPLDNIMVHIEGKQKQREKEKTREEFDEIQERLAVLLEGYTISEEEEMANEKIAMKMLMDPDSFQQKEDNELNSTKLNIENILSLYTVVCQDREETLNDMTSVVSMEDFMDGYKEPVFDFDVDISSEISLLIEKINKKSAKIYRLFYKLLELSSQGGSVRDKMKVQDKLQDANLQRKVLGKFKDLSNANAERKEKGDTWKHAATEIVDLLKQVRQEGATNMEQVEEEFGKLMNAFRAQHDQLAEYQEKLEKQQLTIQKYQKIKENLRNENLLLQEDVDSWRLNQKSTQIKCDKLETSVKGLSKEIKEQKEEKYRNNKEQENKNLGDKTELESKVENLEKTLVKCEVQLSEEKKKNFVLENALRTVSSTNMTKQERLGNEDKVVRKSCSKCIRLTLEISSLQTKLDDSATKYEDVCEKLKDLKEIVPIQQSTQEVNLVAVIKVSEQEVKNEDSFDERSEHNSEANLPRETKRTKRKRTQVRDFAVQVELLQSSMVTRNEVIAQNSNSLEANDNNYQKTQAVSNAFGISAKVFRFVNSIVNMTKSMKENHQAIKPNLGVMKDYAEMRKGEGSGAHSFQGRNKSAERIRKEILNNENNNRKETITGTGEEQQKEESDTDITHQAIKPNLGVMKDYAEMRKGEGSGAQSFQVRDKSAERIRKEILNNENNNRKETITGAGEEQQKEESDTDITREDSTAEKHLIESSRQEINEFQRPRETKDMSNFEAVRGQNNIHRLDEEDEEDEAEKHKKHMSWHHQQDGKTNVVESTTTQLQRREKYNLPSNVRENSENEKYDSFSQRDIIDTRKAEIRKNLMRNGDLSDAVAEGHALMPTDERRNSGKTYNKNNHNNANAFSVNQTNSAKVRESVSQQGLEHQSSIENDPFFTCNAVPIVLSLPDQEGLQRSWTESGFFDKSEVSISSESESKWKKVRGKVTQLLRFIRSVSQVKCSHVRDKVKELESQDLPEDQKLAQELQAFGEHAVDLLEVLSFIGERFDINEFEQHDIPEQRSTMLAKMRSQWEPDFAITNQHSQQNDNQGNVLGQVNQQRPGQGHFFFSETPMSAYNNRERRQSSAYHSTADNNGYSRKSQRHSIISSADVTGTRMDKVAEKRKMKVLERHKKLVDRLKSSGVPMKKIYTILGVTNSRNDQDDFEEMSSGLLPSIHQSNPIQQRRGRRYSLVGHSFKHNTNPPTAMFSQINFGQTTSSKLTSNFTGLRNNNNTQTRRQQPSFMRPDLSLNMRRQEQPTNLMLGARRSVFPPIKMRGGNDSLKMNNLFQTTPLGKLR